MFHDKNSQTFHIIPDKQLNHYAQISDISNAYQSKLQKHPKHFHYVKTVADNNVDLHKRGRNSRNYSTINNPTNINQFTHTSFLDESNRRRLHPWKCKTIHIPKEHQIGPKALAAPIQNAEETFDFVKTLDIVRCEVLNDYHNTVTVKQTRPGSAPLKRRLSAVSQEPQKPQTARSHYNPRSEILQRQQQQLPKSNINSPHYNMELIDWFEKKKKRVT
jgi:hypothetical protein